MTDTCEKDCDSPAEATVVFTDEEGGRIDVCATHAMQLTTEYGDDVEVVSDE